MTETQHFLELNFVKTQLGIEDDDPEYDDQLLQIIESANRRVSMTLLPVLDIRDLESTDFWQDAKTAAFVYARSLFEQRVNKSEEMYKSYKEEYDDTIKILINAIKAQPTKDISKRSIIAMAGTPLRHRLLDNNYGITDNLGNRLNDRFSTSR